MATDLFECTVQFTQPTCEGPEGISSENIALILA